MGRAPQRHRWISNPKTLTKDVRAVTKRLEKGGQLTAEDALQLIRDAVGICQNSRDDLLVSAASRLFYYVTKAKINHGDDYDPDHPYYQAVRTGGDLADVLKYRLPK